MKKCIKCGIDLPDTAKFCANCGTAQNSVSETKNNIDTPDLNTQLNKTQENTIQVEKNTSQNPIPTNSLFDNLLAAGNKIEKTTQDTQNNQKSIPTISKPLQNKVNSNNKNNKDNSPSNQNQPSPTLNNNSKKNSNTQKNLPTQTPEKNISKNENIKSEKTVVEYQGTFSEQDAINEIESWNLSQNDKYLIYNISYSNIRGYKGFFIGNNGTYKETIISNIGNLLYKLKKIKSPEPHFVAFGDIPNSWNSNELYVIQDLRSAINYLFNIEDFSDLASQNAATYKKKLNSLIKAPNNCYIILDGVPSEIKSFQALDPRIAYVYDAKIYFKDLANFEIANIYCEKIPEYHKNLLPENFKEELVHYLERNRRYMPFNNNELAEYLANYTSRYHELKLPEEKYTALSLDEAFSSIIGMNDVKTKVKELQYFLKSRSIMEEAGAILPDMNLHMMFLGNPGIGKTTVARIIGKILFDLGFIREDKFIEVTSKDLVGSGNQTGLKTNRVLQSALGGVLFIDEAYSLSNSCGQAGAEAIANIIKTMEDNKGDIVCMFAGYTLEMHDFVNSNSGISSRINYTFQFQDYSKEELYDIFLLKLKKTKLTLSPEAVPPIKKIIEMGSLRSNFGNGRFIDKLLQRTMTKQAGLNLPREKIMFIQPEAVPSMQEIMFSF